MAGSYRIREFADLAGLTVKALHHYDRVGLLIPERTESGYRLYTEADLGRIRKIVALKSLGLPLKGIKDLLEPGAPPLSAVLRQQRELLDEKRRLLDRTIRALVEAEDGLDAAPGAAPYILETLIEVIGMQDSIDAMRKYYSAEAWEEWRHHYERWPSQEWQELYRDINEALDANATLDATSDAAQAFGSRWLTLETSATTVPAVRTGLRKAWADREHWPEALQQRMAALKVDRAMRFINQVLWERWEAERIERDTRGVTAPARVSPSRRQLYRDGAAALRSDPSSAAAQALVTRWKAILDAETGGDLDTQAEMIRSWRARRTWAPGMTRYIASLYEMDAETWQQVADFIEAALDQSTHLEGSTGDRYSASGQ